MSDVDVSPESGDNEDAFEQALQDSQKWALNKMGWKFGEENKGMSTEAGIAWFNKNFFSISEGHKIRFYRDTRAMRLVGMETQIDWEMAPLKVWSCTVDKNGNDKWKDAPLYKTWKYNFDRRYYSEGFELCTDPKKRTPGTYNIWKGFAVKGEQGQWPLMRSHIREVLANGDAALDEYIVKWAAWSLQHPGTPPKVAIVFRGAEGVGKGMFCDAMTNIFGPAHGLRLQNMNQFTGKFNAHLRNVCLLFVDEAHTVEKEHEGALKGLISESRMIIEGKGVDAIPADNHLHNLMASNEKWAVPVSDESRRFVICDVPKTRKGQPDYFNAIGAELYADGKSVPGAGLKAMIYDLLNMDIKGWHPEKDRVETEALHMQRTRSSSDAEKHVMSWLDTGELPSGVCRKFERKVAKKDLKKAKFIDYTRIHMESMMKYLLPFLKNKPNPVDMADLLRRMGCVNKSINGISFWKVPELQAARTAWSVKNPWDGSIKHWCNTEKEVDNEAFGKDSDDYSGTV